MKNQVQLNQETLLSNISKNIILLLFLLLNFLAITNYNNSVAQQVVDQQSEVVSDKSLLPDVTTDTKLSKIIVCGPGRV